MPEVKLLDPEYCGKCFYRGVIRSTGESFCDYIGFTGKRRPCPGGTGCTARMILENDPTMNLKEARWLRKNIVK